MFIDYKLETTCFGTFGACTRTIYRTILSYLRGNLMMAKSAETCSF